MCRLKQDALPDYTPLLKVGAPLPKPGDLPAADVPAALERCALADKQGRPLSELMETVAAGENALVAVALAAEQPAFAAALLEHFALYAALGIALAARACGAGEVVLYAESEEAAAPLATALATQVPALKAEPLYGLPTPVLREDSALLTALQGRLVRSELLDEPITKSGLAGRPTLPLDVETAIWLAACCTQDAAPGKLMLLEQGGENTLLELPLGTPLSRLAEALELPAKHPFLLGDVTGFFAGGEGLEERQVSYLNSYDSLTVYAEGACMADEGKKLFAQTYDSSCGKCVLCREGSWQFMAIFNDISEGRGKKSDFELVPDIGGLIKAGAFCDYGRRMVDAPMTLMEVARAEIEAHVVRKNCPAGVCAAFIIHMIDPVMCTKCGDCQKACPEGAVVIAAGHMKLPKKLTKVGRFR